MVGQCSDNKSGGAFQLSFGIQQPAAEAGDGVPVVGGGKIFLAVLGAFLSSPFPSEQFDYTQVGGTNHRMSTEVASERGQA